MYLDRVKNAVSTERPESTFILGSEVCLNPAARIRVVLVA